MPMFSMTTTPPAATPVSIKSRVPDPRVLRAINPFITALLRSPLHALVSKHMMLLTYTGQLAGLQRTLPVGYLRDGRGTPRDFAARAAETLVTQPSRRRGGPPATAW
jgi:hypothetical protein